MAELQGSGEKDPYMQAYITARMKNQVEEMKLQKILSGMEVSQRVRKIMINLELFEDRKVAHKLQQEVVNAANRQRQAMNRFLKQKGSNQRMTSNWASTLARSEPAHTSVDLNQSYPAGHPGPAAPSSGGRRAVFPVTAGKDYGPGGGGEFPKLESGRRCVSSAGLVGSPRGKGGGGRKGGVAAAVPAIAVTDCDGGGDSGDRTRAWEDGNATTTELTKPHTATKTATIIAPPHTSHRVHHQHQHHHHPQQQQQYQEHQPSHPASGAAHVASASEPHHPPHPVPHPVPHQYSAPGSHYFPPVIPSRARSTRTVRTREEQKRLASAASLWPGDPRAISSVRRERRHIDEMLATQRAGEETRRLTREAPKSCSRNCSKPDIMSQLGRAYCNLPELLPEIEKVRQRFAEEEAASREMPDGFEAAERLGLASADKKKSTGRFDLADEAGDDVASCKNLPIYQINYNSLREIGNGTGRRNSVLI